MASASMDWEQPRERLARLILDVIEAWPERDRRIFVAARYRGMSLGRIAREQGMPTGEVRLVVEDCERRLYRALRRFREDDEAPAPAAGRGDRMHCMLSRPRI